MTYEAPAIQTTVELTAELGKKYYSVRVGTDD